ncbi:MAG: hypothetical protein ABI743_02695, partial [bacterium]
MAVPAVPPAAVRSDLPPPRSWLGRLLSWPVLLLNDEPVAQATTRRVACTIACWEVLAFQLALYLTTGELITALTRHLGFGPQMLGILLVLPSAAPILHPISAWAVERLGRKKPFHLWLVAIARLA